MFKKILLRFSKFASVGLFCATISLSCNFILLKYFSTPLVLTYVMINLGTILISYILNSYFTYQSTLSFRKLFSYYLIYFSSLILGICLLNAYEYLFDFENWVYPFMVTPITMVWNFFYASKILKPNEIF